MKQLIDYSLALYQRGQEMAQEKGLILVDTKYEFGILDGQVILMDEIHTPDSSRYFYLNSYQELFEKDMPQKQLSKEFVREWLIANDFRGLSGQKIPVITDEFVEEISQRYILLYEEITGLNFIKADQGDINSRIFNNSIHFLNHVNK
jgi:phosphoribosylaminoimidazole-succinocarboxamide synthase